MYLIESYLLAFTTYVKSKIRNNYVENKTGKINLYSE